MDEITNVSDLVLIFSVTAAGGFLGGIIPPVLLAYLRERRVRRTPVVPVEVPMPSASKYGLANRMRLGRPMQMPPPGDGMSGSGYM